MARPLAIWGYQWLCLIWLRPGRPYLGFTYLHTHSILQQWIFHEPPLCHNTKTVKAFYILRNNLLFDDILQNIFRLLKCWTHFLPLLLYLRVYSVYHLYVRAKLLSVRPAKWYFVVRQLCSSPSLVNSSRVNSEYLFNTRLVLYSVSRASDRLEQIQNDRPAGDLQPLQDCWVILRLCLPRHPQNWLQRDPGHRSFPSLSLSASSSTELATEGPRSDKLSFFVIVCLVIHRIGYRGTWVRQVVLLCLCLVRHF